MANYASKVIEIAENEVGYLELIRLKQMLSINVQV
jgi:hypothetical protein